MSCVSRILRGDLESGVTVGDCLWRGGDCLWSGVEWSAWPVEWSGGAVPGLCGIRPARWNSCTNQAVARGAFSCCTATSTIPCRNSCTEMHDKGRGPAAISGPSLRSESLAPKSLRFFGWFLKKFNGVYGAPHCFAKIRQVSAVGGSPSESKCLDSGVAKTNKN